MTYITANPVIPKSSNEILALKTIFWVNLCTFTIKVVHRWNWHLVRVFPCDRASTVTLTSICLLTPGANLYLKILFITCTVGEIKNASEQITLENKNVVHNVSKYVCACIFFYREQRVVFKWRHTNYDMFDFPLNHHALYYKGLSDFTNVFTKSLPSTTQNCYVIYGRTLSSLGTLGEHQK